MIVFFSGSARNLAEDLPTYRKITNAIRLDGHALHNDWVETQWLRDSTPVEHGGGRPWDIESIVREVELSIQNADVLIAETTDRSAFGVGYEVASGLHQKKPVLALNKKGTNPMSYSSGLRHALLTVKEYDGDSLEKLVHEFLAENEISTKDLRFNFVIDRRLYHHLRWKSFKSRKTKAEVMRELLIKDMEGED